MIRSLLTYFGIFFRTIYLAIPALYILLCGLFISYLDNTAECFPATIITTKPEIIDNIVQEYNLCSYNVSREKMMIETSIMNTYEKPPVKDIFLITLKTSYQQLSGLKSNRDITIQTNPFVKNMMMMYVANKLKLHIALFLFGTIIMLFATSKAYTKDIETLKGRQNARLFYIVWYILLFSTLLLFIPTVFRTTSIMISVIGFIVYLIFQMFSYREIRE